MMTLCYDPRRPYLFVYLMTVTIHPRCDYLYSLDTPCACAIDEISCSTHPHHHEVYVHASLAVTVKEKKMLF